MKLLGGKVSVIKITFDGRLMSETVFRVTIFALAHNVFSLNVYR